MSNLGHSRVVAKYNVSYFDYSWNEMVERRRTGITAHEMIHECVERWNQDTQREARNTDVVVIPNNIASYISIEVIYVEGKETQSPTSRAGDPSGRDPGAHR